mgnify:CR=1 FL=1
MRTGRTGGSQKRTVEDDPEPARILITRRPRVTVGTDSGQRSRITCTETRRREEILPKRTCKNLDTTQQTSIGTGSGVQTYVRAFAVDHHALRAGRNTGHIQSHGTDRRQPSGFPVAVPRRREASGITRKCLDTTQRKTARTVTRAETNARTDIAQCRTAGTRRYRIPIVSFGTEVRQHPQIEATEPRRREASGITRKCLDTTQRKTECTSRSAGSREYTKENRPVTIRALTPRRPNLAFGADIRGRSRLTVTVTRRRKEAS